MYKFTYDFVKNQPCPNFNYSLDFQVVDYTLLIAGSSTAPVVQNIQTDEVSYWLKMLFATRTASKQLIPHRQVKAVLPFKE